MPRGSPLNRRRLPSSSPPGATIGRLGQHRSRGVSRDFIPPSSGDIHDQGDAHWIQTRSAVVALADGEPVCVERAPGCQVFEGGTITDAVTPPAYTITARVLHWITAFLILSMIPLGVVIANEWGGSAQDSPYDLHRSIGAAVIPLVILRLIYRWTHSPLPLPDDILAMQRLAAHVTHWGLYALLIVQPFTGCIATSAYRAPVIVFGWFELPPIGPRTAHFPSSFSQFTAWSGSPSPALRPRISARRSTIILCVRIASSCA
jgi:cytochrome b561